jgi:WD40 repeat protein
LTNYQHRVWSLAFSPTDNTLATANADHTLRIFNVATCAEIERLEGHGGEVTCVAFSGDGQRLVSGGYDKTGMLWSAHPDRTLTTISNVISSPVFSPDGQWVAAGIGQDTVALWEVATFRPKKIFAGAHDALAFSSDGSGLITRGTNYFLRTFDVASETIRETVAGPGGPEASHATLSPDGELLATGMTNGSIILQDAKTVSIKATLTTSYDGLFPSVFSPDGKLLVTMGRTKATETRLLPPKIWSVVTHKVVAELTNHTGLVLSAAFSSDGRTLATCATDDSVKLWDTTTWREKLPSFEVKEYVSALAFSPDRQTLATACSDYTLKLWNLATGREVASLPLTFYASHLVFSPDGQTLAAWSAFVPSRRLQLWRAPGVKRP